MVSASRVMQNAAERGKITSFNSFSRALLTFINRPTFKAQVSRFEKYIIHIKPRSPKIGKISKIRIILITESEIAVLKVKVVMKCQVVMILNCHL